VNVTQRFFIATLILCGINTANAADDQLVLYGRVNMSLETSKAGSSTATTPQSTTSTLSAISGSSSVSPGSHDAYVVDNTSRFGLRGTENLSDGFSAVFQYETTLNSNAPLRDTFVGIQHDNWGAFRLGRISTSNYVSWEGRNLNDINFDSGTTGDRLWHGFVRLSSSLTYETPWINHFKASA